MKRYARQVTSLLAAIILISTLSPASIALSLDYDDHNHAYEEEHSHTSQLTPESLVESNSEMGGTVTAESGADSSEPNIVSSAPTSKPEDPPQQENSSILEVPVPSEDIVTPALSENDDVSESLGTGGGDFYPKSDMEVRMSAIYQSGITSEMREALTEYYDHRETYLDTGSSSNATQALSSLGLTVCHQDQTTSTYCGPCTIVQTFTHLYATGHANRVPSLEELTAPGNTNGYVNSQTDMSILYSWLNSMDLASNGDGNKRATVFYDFSDVLTADGISDYAKQSIHNNIPPILHISRPNGDRSLYGDTTKWPYTLRNSGHYINIDGVSGDELTIADPAVRWKVNELPDSIMPPAEKAKFDNGKFPVTKEAVKATYNRLFFDVHEHQYKDGACVSGNCVLCGLYRQGRGHTYESATCTTAATCKNCGQIAAAPKGHKNITIGTIISGSCQSTGLAAVRCTVCGTNGSEITPKTSHSYTVPATCTRGTKCAFCSSTTGSPTAHNFVITGSIVAGSCKSTGLAATKCTECSATGQEVTPMMAHSFTVAATCTTAKKCVSCSDTLGSSLGHDFVRTGSILAGSCVSTGLAATKCSRCSATGQEVTPVTAHSFTVAATCSIGKKCAFCSATSSSPLGHDFVRTGSILAGSCKSTGLAATKCSRCSATGQEVTPVTAHSFTVAATCTSAKKCAFCSTTSGSSLGHNFVKTGSILAGSCISTGLAATKCSRCSATGQEVTPVSAHSFTVAATCTTAKKCAFCSTTSGSSLGHNFAASTCTQPQKCTRCGATASVALGHSYNAATCTTAKKCVRCAATSGSALGHSYNAATCTSAKKCTRCAITSGSSLGHSWTYLAAGTEYCLRCSATRRM